MCNKTIAKIAGRWKETKWTLIKSDNGIFTMGDLVIISQLLEQVYIEKKHLSNRELAICKKALLLIQTVIHENIY